MLHLSLELGLGLVGRSELHLLCVHHTENLEAARVLEEVTGEVQGYRRRGAGPAQAPHLVVGGTVFHSPGPVSMCCVSPLRWARDRARGRGQGRGRGRVQSQCAART